MVVGSPGVGGTSNSSSSSGASWRSGTPSPPLSDEGAPSSLWPTSAHSSHNQQHYPYNVSGSSSSSTPGSTTTLDEGIVPDYLEEQHPRKKKVSSMRSFLSIDRSMEIEQGEVCLSCEIRTIPFTENGWLANRELGLGTAQGKLSCRFIVELSRFLILPFMAELFFALSPRGDARDQSS